MEKSPVIRSPFKQWPYSVRLCFQILLVLLIVFIIVQCKVVLVPLYFSLLLSILLLPLTNYFEKIHFPHAFAALLSVLIAFVIIVGVIYLLSAQIAAFLNDIPAIKKHVAEHYQTLQTWIEARFNISTSQQQTIVSNAASDIEDRSMDYITQTFFTLAETIAFLIFTLLYSFLILYYRRTIRNFLFAIFTRAHKSNVDAVLTGTKQVIKRYMTGLVIEMMIISTANSLLLTIIGIKYAGFLGVFTGLLNVIPYIGIYTGMAFTALVALTTPASMSQILWIFIGFLCIHFVDTNFLMPRIVGSKVKINALITILGAITGGFLIGIPGVFFALPTIAILKIIFDRIEELKPWGILLGGESAWPDIPLSQKIRNRISNKKIQKNKQAAEKA